MTVVALASEATEHPRLVRSVTFRRRNELPVAPPNACSPDGMLVLTSEHPGSEFQLSPQFAPSGRE